jgi:hypothetical protein
MNLVGAVNVPAPLHSLSRIDVSQLFYDLSRFSGPENVLLHLLCILSFSASFWEFVPTCCELANPFLMTVHDHPRMRAAKAPKRRTILCGTHP